MSAKFSNQHQHDADQVDESKKNRSYSQLLMLCLSLDKKYEESDLQACGADFAIASGYVYDEIRKFESKIKNLPFVSIVLLWARYVIKGPLGIPNIEMMNDLIENKILGFKNGKALTLGEFATCDQDLVIDSIRSNKEWIIWKREEYVHLYINFADWLSEVAFGLIPKASDRDRLIAEKRKLPFNQYIKILNELQDRERVLAKIFYLGGARFLEEVLSLKIEDIDYFNKTIKISGESISYPGHVLNDLLDYIGDRKKGFVFSGKGGERINHTVPYRALKSVISKLKLDPSFTFKEFVKNS
jgi:integrase